MAPTLRIRHFTDPACPFAYSAEPSRWALRWFYGDALEWEDRMVVLARDPREYEDKGFGVEKHAASLERFELDYGMPFATHERPRMAATAPACLAVVATRLRAPGHEEAILRRLRIATMSGALLDEPTTIARAAEEAGLDPDEVATWSEEPEVLAALEQDAAAARDPSPEALALTHKLARDGDGWRYTCPSYEIERIDDGRRLSVPGFQPLAAYEVAVANLAPELGRRERAEDATEVLVWAREPLAAAEVGAVLGVSREDAQERLSAGDAEERDGWWALAETAVR